MPFSHSKFGHFTQILTSGVFGEVVLLELVPPSPTQIQMWGTVVIQVLVGLVTIWATIRKALQQPQAVVPVPLPADVVPVVPAAAAPSGPIASLPVGHDDGR